MLMKLLSLTLLMVGLAACEPATPTHRTRMGHTTYLFDKRTNLCFIEFPTAYGYHGYSEVPCNPEVMRIAVPVISEQVHEY